MNTALFTYRRRVVDKSGVERYNDNFINPLNVTSFFWETSEADKPVLSVFLNAVRATQNGSNAFSITFGEAIGIKFVNHMEDFLRYLIGSGKPVQVQSVQAPKERHARRAVDAEVVEEDIPQTAATEWVQN